MPTNILNLNYPELTFRWVFTLKSNTMKPPTITQSSKGQLKSNVNASKIRESHFFQTCQGVWERCSQTLVYRRTLHAVLPPKPTHVTENVVRLTVMAVRMLAKSVNKNQIAKTATAVHRPKPAFQSRDLIGSSVPSTHRQTHVKRVNKIQNAKRVTVVQPLVQQRKPNRRGLRIVRRIPRKFNWLVMSQLVPTNQRLALRGTRKRI